MELAGIQDAADRAAALLTAMASPNRLKISCTLVEGERPVGALAEEAGLRGTAVSQHLGLLRRDGLVQGRRDGQTVHDALAGDDARRLIATLYETFCAETPATSSREVKHED